MKARRSSTGEWKPFADAGLLPDPSGLFLIARAITPPGRVTPRSIPVSSQRMHRQSPITSRRVVHADAELVELVWVELGSQPLADAHAMTKRCRCVSWTSAWPQARWRTMRTVPFFHWSMAAKCTRMCWGRKSPATPSPRHCEEQRRPVYACCASYAGLGSRALCAKAEAISFLVTAKLDCFLRRNDGGIFSRPLAN